MENKNMEEFVYLKLETYNDLKENISDLEFSISEHRREKKDMLNAMNEQTNDINNLHKYIMEKNLNVYHFEGCSLEELTDFDNVNFAMCYKSNLLRLGITELEMIEFIKEKYNEWKEEKEDNE